jgi:nitroreductase
MAVSDIGDLKVSEDSRTRWIGVYVGVLATLLAICGLGGGNATKDATRANIEVTNMWAFFQAKNVRRTAFSLAADELELSLKTNPGLAPEARQAVEDKIKAYRDTVAAFTSDKVRNEGLDEIFQRAKALEAERDVALRKDPYFDLAQALLQIAIVLASVALIAGANALLLGSGILAVAGTLFMINGFTLAVTVPFLG